MEHKPKVLFTASIAKHFIRFHQPYLEWFREQGFEVHVACSGDEKVPFTDKKWDVPFVRSPYSFGHFRAYRTLKNIIDTENYKLIHCHTPMASVITRLAANKARQNGSKVVYTAHGFHFFKGGPFFNWLTYYPVELLLSSKTNAVITINREDYNLIQSHGASKTDYFLIPGIGVEPGKFHPVSKEEKFALRKKNGYSSEHFITTYAAEFINRKNHKFIVECATNLARNIPNLKILFAGRGELKEQLEERVRDMGLEETILFLGFRNDIDEVFKMSDIGISASKQEGLPLNLVEVMMCGVPVVATIDRGHKEIVRQGENGFLFEQNQKKEFVKYITEIATNDKQRMKMREEAVRTSKKFEVENSLNEMAAIYRQIIPELNGISKDQE